MTYVRGTGLKRLHSPCKHLHLAFGELGSRACGLTSVVSGVRHYGVVVG